MGKCVRCGKRTRVASGGWSGEPKPRCSKCGGELDPSARALPDITGPSPDGEPLNWRRCESCGAKLRLGHVAELCSPCELTKRMEEME